MPNGVYARLDKRANMTEACLGTAVIYAVTIENIHTHPLIDVMFRDAIPRGLNFRPGSVEINRMPYANYNPNLGFPITEIMPGDIKEINFTAEAAYVPTDTAVNIANINFRTILHDEELGEANENSNPVSVIIKDCRCDEGTCEKDICKLYSISFPFTVKPFAKNKTPDIMCFGELTLHEGHVHCQDPRREFEYTLTQRVKVELPVAFGAEVCYEEPCAEDDGECEET